MPIQSMSAGTKSMLLQGPDTGRPCGTRRPGKTMNGMRTLKSNRLSLLARAREALD
jgi:hypothetical protein